MAALLRVRQKLKEHQLPHYAWHEPDYNYGLTAIATAPLDVEQKQVLRNYHLWKHECEDRRVAQVLRATESARMQM